jgi:hypothetical protein
MPSADRESLDNRPPLQLPQRNDVSSHTIEEAARTAIRNHTVPLVL